MKNIKSLIFSVLLFLGSFTMPAAHILGGQIYWDCAGNGDYIFTLEVYRDCAGTIFPATSQTISGPLGTIICPYIPALSGTITPGCLSCANNDYGAVERLVFQSAPISLSGIPPTNGWEFSWGTCCRSAAQNSTAIGNGLYLHSVMYPFTDSMATMPRDASPCYDSSPRFNAQFAAIACPNASFNYALAPSDPNFDSILVYWATPQSSSSLGISFSPGYSFNSPFPGPSQNPMNSTVLLDSTSGVLSVNAQNPNPGWYYSAQVVQSYRSGQLVAEVFRDAPLFYLTPIQCAPNNAPTLSVDSLGSTPFTAANSVYRLSARPGDSIHLNLLGLELDQNPNLTFQSTCYSGLSTMFNASSLLDTAGCIGPCATLLPSNGGTNYCSTLQNNASFKWQPTCATPASNAAGQAQAEYRFWIKLKDDACAVPGEKNVVIIVDLLGCTLSKPRLSLLAQNSSGLLQIAWTQSQMSAGGVFKEYVLYESLSAQGPFLAIDTIYRIDSLSTSVQAAGFPGFYYLQAKAGPCSVSQISDTLSTSGIGLREWHQKTHFTLYPNPVNDHLILLIDQAKTGQIGLAKGQIFNSNGQIVWQGDLSRDANGEFRIPLNLKQGSYTLVVVSDLGTEQLKFIVGLSDD
jgi:hypothetical protein